MAFHQEQLHARWGRGRKVVSSKDADSSEGSVGMDRVDSQQVTMDRVDSRQVTMDAEAVLAQCHQALKPGGHLCVVSYEPPSGRSWLLGDCSSLKGWSVLACGWEHKETGNYIYVLRKD